MENEKVAIEAIAEEGARAYSKTVWTETTPITADKLNKMETGIADASKDIAKCLPLTGGTLTGSVCAEVSSGPGLITRRASQANSRTMMYASTAAGEHIFGGNNNGTVEPTDFIRVGVNKLKYETNGKAYDIYHTGNKPTAAAIGAMGTSSPTFEGNLYQNGPNGYDWIYHINADRGTLNIAPRVNGNPDWGKQIYIDRNGQIHCNGNRRVATINQENPAHHMIRYGAGMGGADGYITFSW